MCWWAFVWCLTCVYLKFNRLKFTDSRYELNISAILTDVHIFLSFNVFFIHVLFLTHRNRESIQIFWGGNLRRMDFLKLNHEFECVVYVSVSLHKKNKVLNVLKLYVSVIYLIRTGFDLELICFCINYDNWPISQRKKTKKTEKEQEKKKKFSFSSAKL